jgi:transcription elongation GreA/GreB family factor
MSKRESLPLDQVFEILKNRRRREVVKYLNERDESVSLSDLAEHVAAIENDTTVNASVSTSVSTSAISRRWTI